MPWKLQLSDQTKTNVLRELTPASPGGLDVGFTWQTDGYGNVIRLEVQGRNDTLTLPPRGVLELSDGPDALAFGIAPDVPSLDSPDAETITADGGREALRLALMDSAVYRDAGVFSIVRDVLTRLRPPCLGFDATLIGDGTGTDAGPSFGTYYAPTASLADVLDGLAKSAQTQWAVNARGLVEFGRPAPAPLVIPFAGQPWRRLQVQGRETVTQAVVRVISAAGGEAPTTAFSVLNEREVPYTPATIGSRATHALHDTFQASAVTTAPEGVALTKIVRIPGSTYGTIENPGNATDGDPDTSALLVGDGINPSITLTSPASSGRRVIGVHLRYALQVDVTNDYSFVLLVSHSRAGPAGTGNWTLTKTNEPGEAYHPRELIALFPPDLKVPLDAAYDTTATVQGGATFNYGGFLVYDFALITVDEAAALRVAESSLQVPFSRPAEIVLPGIVPPTPQVTVTGSPDGDVTGPAPLWEYSITRDGGRQTKVRIGATGQDQTVRALKWAVKQ